MRKTTVILITLTIFFAFTACASTPQPHPSDNCDTPSGITNDIEINLDINDNIYDLSGFFPGYSVADAYNAFAYQMDGEVITLNIYEEGQYFSKNVMGSLKSQFTKETEGQIEYYFRTNTYSDETRSGGTKYTWIMLSADGYDFVLTGIEAGKKDKSAVTIDLLIDLLADEEVQGLKLAGQTISARLTDGLRWCGVGTCSEDGLEDLRHLEGTTLLQEEGISYILSAPERQLDDPNSREILLRTNDGALRVFCNVSYDDRNKVSSEELDFIDYSLAQAIAAHLGIKIVSMEESFIIEDQTEIHHKKELSWSDEPWKSFADIVNELKKNDKSNSAEFDIPKYYEDDLLFDTNGLFWLGRDAGYYACLDVQMNEAGAFLATYPTEAVRIKDNGTVYTIHDTDSGYRLYVFFDKSNGYSIPVGMPIVMKRLLSYTEFSGLKEGDPIELVEEIDSVATLHKRVIKDVWKLNPLGAANYAKDGVPCTSIHYLKNGLLVIEYKMLENGDLVISNIKYNDDHTLNDILGNSVDYSINEIDLPNR